jgi:hypothetical protein
MLRGIGLHSSTRQIRQRTKNPITTKGMASQHQGSEELAHQLCPSKKLANAEEQMATKSE